MKGPAAALGAAVLFGLSAPLAKVLLADAKPLVLSGLLYLGAGVGLLLLPIALPRLRSRRSETPLRRADIGLLVTSTPTLPPTPQVSHMRTHIGTTP